MGSSVDAHVSGNIGTTISGGMSLVGPVGPVTVDGIPDEFSIRVKELPKITIGVDPLHVSIDKLPKLQIGLDPLELGPIELKLTELPSMRAHLPADFHVGLSLLGRELMGVRVCGEAQVITEPYKPNPCERCGGLIAEHVEGPVLTHQPAG
jgi:hypothetical protein